MRPGLALAPALAALSAVLAAAAPPSWALGPFTRPVPHPVIVPDAAPLFRCPLRRADVRWESLHTFNPAAVVRNGQVYVLYRAEDDSGTGAIGSHTSRLGLAVSRDGIHFTRNPTPVFYPAPDSQKDREWPGGCEDPRLVEAPDGRYVLTYTQWNGKIWRAASATSPDLIHWTKHGPLFNPAPGARYSDLHYKSAGIVTRLVSGRLVAAKINGLYWMYWGEGRIHLATSPDLVSWRPLEDKSGALIDVLGPRPGRFDSDFPEVGPPPVLTPSGIVLLYNGRNAAPPSGDASIGVHAYATGQALFDPHHPERLLARLDQPSLRPQEPYERSGQYAAGTTFAEGLVLFRGQWLLYYGCADSFVGLASAPAPRP